MADDDVFDLPDPSLLDQAIKNSGTAADVKDYMVAVDIASGKVTTAWKGTARHTGRGYENTEQYPVKALTLAAARRSGEIIHKTRGRK